jgi:hypothetical protein
MRFLRGKQRLLVARDSRLKRLKLSQLLLA